MAANARRVEVVERFVKRRQTTTSLKKKLAEKKRLAEETVTFREAALLAEIVRNGGNIRAACARLEIPYHAGLRYKEKPAFKRLLEEAVLAFGEDLKDWGTLAVRAQRVLEDLLDAKDEKIRKDVAFYLIDRALGKAPQKVDATITSRSEHLSEVEMQAALSLVQEHGLTLTEASRYVRENPEEVMAWAATQVERAREARALPPVQEAEVVEST